MRYEHLLVRDSGILTKQNYESMKMQRLFLQTQDADCL